MGNEFGDYHCDRQDQVESAKGMYFFGAITGFVIISTLADNLGRKLSLVICLVVGTIGYSMMILARSLVVAGLGDFMVGFSI